MRFMGMSGRKPVLLACSLVFLVSLSWAVPLIAQDPKPGPATVAAWDRYIELTKGRIQSEVNHPATFVRSDFNVLRTSSVWIQRMETKEPTGKAIDVPGGAIHHWLGAIFVPGKTVDSVISWVQDYDRHQQYFKDVEQSALRKREGETFEAYLRLRRSKMGVTARFNTDHRIVYTRHASDRVSSESIGIRIRQLDRSGKEYPPGRDSGYLWRLNSYWRFSQRDGGVIVECESVGLSRPLGSFIGFLDFFTFGRIKRIADSVAEEALRDTLTSLRDGLLN